MTPEELQETTEAFDTILRHIQQGRNRLVREYPAFPASANKNLQTAEKAIRAAVEDVHNAYAHTPPEADHAS